MRWWASFVVLVMAAGAVLAQAPGPPDSLTQKQLAMLHAEAEFFATLANQQKDELEKLKAAPCGGEPKGDGK